MAQFSDEYFQAEVRDGFYIEEMMKRAWAAQIEVLEVVDEICKRHGITWYAYYGTMLGAVRHNGFIPWDDDIDISMKREDYERFIKIASKELPAGLMIGDFNENGIWTNSISRVLTTGIDFRTEHMTKFHGCPYVVGVDIFILDYLPPIEEEANLVADIVHIILSIISKMESGDETRDDEEIESLVSQIEGLCKVSLKRGGELKSQLLKLADNVCKLYGADECDEMTVMYYFMEEKKRNRRMKKEWYSETVLMPFETIMIPVPKGYDKILTKVYGEDYMTPVRITSAHEYPFYKRQDVIIEAKLREMQENS